MKDIQKKDSIQSTEAPALLTSPIKLTTLPPIVPQPQTIISLQNISSIEELRSYLLKEGCRACSLGFQPEINGVCLSRGNPLSRRMLIGEAAGKTEDSTRLPFTGPAGELLDKVFASVGLDTNKDFYLTNSVLCRPYLPKGSGKENFTPKTEQIKKCRPYLDKQIEIVKPKLIVLLGKVAIANLFPEFVKTPMSTLRGRIEIRDGITYFFMLHTAAILHAKPVPIQYELYKEQMWEDINSLKELIVKENL